MSAPGKLPSWLPLAAVGLGILLFIVLWNVPRESETADTLLEGIPFVVFFIALALVPFSVRGWPRHVGLAVASLLALAPWWVPAAFVTLEDWGADRSSVTLTVRLEGEGAYVFAFPAFVDDQEDLAAVHDGLPLRDPPVSLSTEAGAPTVQTEGSGSTTWSAMAHGDEGAEWWPTTDWGDGEPRLLEGDGPVSFLIQLQGVGRWCGGTLSWSGTVDGGTVQWDQQKASEIACT